MAVPVDAKSEELVAFETLDEGRVARIWLNRPERTTLRAAACWSSSTRRSCGPRPTTPFG